MNLYLIERTDKTRDLYDYFDSAVVAASTEEDARQINLKDSRTDNDSPWVKPDQVKVTQIGVAAQGISGIVLSSFNAA